MKKENEPLKAVALNYPCGSDAPFIAAKAKGVLAQKLVQIAEEQKIPVVEDKIATDILTVEEIGACIPEETWKIIAQIFAFVMDNNKKM